MERKERGMKMTLLLLTSRDRKDSYSHRNREWTHRSTSHSGDVRKLRGGSLTSQKDIRWEIGRLWPLWEDEKERTPRPWWPRHWKVVWVDRRTGIPHYQLPIRVQTPDDHNIERQARKSSLQRPNQISSLRDDDSDRIRHPPWPTTRHITTRLCSQWTEQHEADNFSHDWRTYLHLASLKYRESPPRVSMSDILDETLSISRRRNSGKEK